MSARGRGLSDYSPIVTFPHVPMLKPKNAVNSGKQWMENVYKCTKTSFFTDSWLFAIQDSRTVTISIHCVQFSFSFYSFNHTRSTVKNIYLKKKWKGDIHPATRNVASINITSTRRGISKANYFLLKRFVSSAVLNLRPPRCIVRSLQESASLPIWRL